MSFDRIAPWYRALEWTAFGNSLQRCRIACLDEIAPPRRALIAGEGNGRFLSELLRRWPATEIDCVDASGKMLELARERLEAKSVSQPNRVRFVRDDMKSWDCPEHRYDLVVTHFFLDCFPDSVLGQIIEKLAHAATADATWLVADFRIPGDGLARLRAQAWLKAMYLFFRVTTRIEAHELIDPDPMLRAERFNLTRQHLFRGGMLKSELWRRG